MGSERRKGPGTAERCDNESSDSLDEVHILPAISGGGVLQSRRSDMRTFVRLLFDPSLDSFWSEWMLEDLDSQNGAPLPLPFTVLVGSINFLYLRLFDRPE
jgi:hypothetical protein